MADERLRIPQDPDYFHAVGLAVIAFARLEWDAVWCCEKLEPGYLNTIEEKIVGGRLRQGQTATDIARHLQSLFQRIAEPALRKKATPFATAFVALAKERNGLLHGKPGTAPSGDQRLFRHSAEWTTEAVNAFADRCVVASLPLNALLHDELFSPGAVSIVKSKLRPIRRK